jgi:hypothetical protein
MKTLGMISEKKIRGQSLIEKLKENLTADGH